MYDKITAGTATQKILSIDIGGSNVKATLLDAAGQTLMEYQKIETPLPATPKAVMIVITQLAQRFPGYDKISTGFPGYVKDGIVHTAPNLGTDYWQDTNLAADCCPFNWANLPKW